MLFRLSTFPTFQNHWQGHQVGWKGTRECCSDFPLSPLSKTIGSASSWVERYLGVLFRLSTFPTFQNHWECHQVGWKGTWECCSDFPLSHLSKTNGRVIKLGGKVPGNAVQTFHFLHFPKPLGGSSSWVERYQGVLLRLSTFSTFQNHWEGHQVGWKGTRECCSDCPLSPLSKTIGVESLSSTPWYLSTQLDDPPNGFGKWRKWKV